ncbi:PAS domain protein [Jannaschia seosinensis]|uniref:PAS domain protein n=1 Tax=Jannaschia seosinensis TaxID=313367 RepID=A0A0M7BCQ0_9RHOB|nr:PAS domain-containing protein [Jannaschia seosinensis]CUH39592.1 PAS domain protein [Jannaschia seosinensis]
MAGHDSETGGADRVRNFTGLRMMRNSPILEETWRYWTSLRRGTAIPQRSTLDPSAMRLILGHAMILDRTRHGTTRVRLGGHVMQDLMGMEVRGLPIRAFFDLADRTRVCEQIEQVFEQPAKLELDLISEGSEGIVTARMLVLPLTDATGAVSKALTVMVCDRITRDAPRRFSLTKAQLTPLCEVAEADHPRRRHTDRALPHELTAGMAESAAPFEGRPSQVPWLRIVK